MNNIWVRLAMVSLVGVSAFRLGYQIGHDAALTGLFGPVRFVNWKSAPPGACLDYHSGYYTAWPPRDGMCFLQDEPQ